MSKEECALPGCSEVIILHGIGYQFKKVIKGKDGERKTVFFCSAEHQKADDRPDLNEIVQMAEEPI